MRTGNAVRVAGATLLALRKEQARRIGTGVGPRAASLAQILAECVPPGLSALRAKRRARAAK